jgi:SAM-dependent methyltransferase
MLCTVCGGAQFTVQPVLWPQLIEQWQLSPAELAYVDRQQGECCSRCGANLRSIALANALRAVAGTPHMLRDFAGSVEAAQLRILELNEAGTLHSILSQMPGHIFGAYPQVDMHALPWPDQAFDIDVHSDTLEHVPNPVHALVECRRVLKPGGTLCLTVPIIVGRLTRGRAGLTKSYHGDPQQGSDDYMVHTEFGADAWCFLMEAGYSEVSIFPVAYPAALAIAARR